LFISTTSTPDNGTGNGTATVQPTSGTPPFVILWSDSQNTLTAIGLTAGDYIVSVEDSNGCITNDTVTVNLLNSISMLQSDEKVLLYPNPTSNKVTIEFLEKNIDYLITIKDLLGKEIKTIVPRQGNKKITFELSGNASGIYIVNISFAQQNIIRRIILTE
jgi:hypothetical protein